MQFTSFQQISQIIYLNTISIFELPISLTRITLIYVKLKRRLFYVIATVQVVPQHHDGAVLI
jgi:hypothetical protein